MAKKPFNEAEESGDDWLLSYADMMTLIACFFILMMAFANFDPAGFSEKSKVIAKHFSKGKIKISEIKLTQMKDEITKHPELEKMTKITVHDSSMVISLSGTVLFPQNGHILNSKMKTTLDSLIDIIKTFNPNYLILVEGHTDKSKVDRRSILSSHWAIASARAASVLDRFEYFGFEPKNLKMISYGDTRPLAKNFNKKGDAIIDNMKLNRRVVIKVIESINKDESVKLGLGLLYQDSKK